MADYRFIQNAPTMVVRKSGWSWVEWTLGVFAAASIGVCAVFLLFPAPSVETFVIEDVAYTVQTDDAVELCLQLRDNPTTIFRMKEESPCADTLKRAGKW